MTSAQVVEASVNVTSSSPSQDYTHPDDHNLPNYACMISPLLFTLVIKIFTDPGLRKFRHSSLVCRCGFTFSSSFFLYIFPNCLVPLFQSQSCCIAFHMQRSFSFTCKFVHQASPWKRGSRLWPFFWVFSGTIYVPIHDVPTRRSKMAAYQDVVAPHQDWPVSSIFS